MSDWNDWIGKSSTSEAYLDPGQANRMAVTLDRDPRFRAGDELPAPWHWLYFHDLAKASDLGMEGHPRLGLFMPPVPLPRRMWAGGSFVFHAQLRLGETATRTSVIRSIRMKEGRSGPLCFVSVEHTICTGAQTNIVEEQTIVYRELSSIAESRESVPAPLGSEYSQEYLLDSTALFRYSALTFNGHRIHYDVDYCREVEGYPNLVIHGPLIATLLLDLYVRQGAPLKRFSYRATSLLLLPHGFTLHGRREGSLSKLWASSHQGGLAMEGEAEETGA
jgi:3-methylfumaryl-CoA hydratase